MNWDRAFLIFVLTNVFGQTSDDLSDFKPEPLANLCSQYLAENPGVDVKALGKLYERLFK